VWPTERLLAVSCLSDHERAVRATKLNRLRFLRGRTQEASRECRGSRCNGSDSRQNIKIFYRINRLNVGRFARPLASPVPGTPPYNQPL
jgi:hypothetical protein